MKFNKKLKKGFTLVELIVVIAIVAILAAVSVVSYIAFINSANESADVQLVKQLNVALQADETLNGPRDTMHEMLGAMEDNGFVVENLTKTKSGYDIVWDQEHNRFGLLNGEDLVYGESTYNSAKAWNIWKFADTEDEAKNKSYSVYLTEEFAKTGVTELDIKAGLDVGNNVISTINYVNDAEHNYVNDAEHPQTVVIRTNSQFTDLTVNAPNDVVTHYGVGQFLTITAVADSSYHEYGSWQKITLSSGNLEIASNAFVGEVVKNGGTLVNNGVIAKAITGTDASAGITGTGITNIISSDTSIKVGNAETLMNLAMAQSTGVFGNNALNIELTADIDLTGKTWVPFGAEFDETHVVYTGNTYTAAYPFQGTINGNNHSIIGFNNGNYDNLAAISQNNYTNVTGYKYGFIVCVTGNITVKDLYFKDVDIDAQGSKTCGVVIGNTMGADSIILDNVDVLSGTIKAKDKAAGLIGYVEEKPNMKPSGITLTVKNCNINIDITATYGGFRAGGLFGFIGTGTGNKININIIDCSYDGNITVGLDNSNGSWLGGITSGLNFEKDDATNNPSKITVKNFQMKGTCVTERQMNKSGNQRYITIGTDNKYLISYCNGKNVPCDNTVGTITGDNVHLNDSSFIIEYTREETAGCYRIKPYTE